MYKPTCQQANNTPLTVPAESGNQGYFQYFKELLLVLMEVKIPKPKFQNLNSKFQI